MKLCIEITDSENERLSEYIHARYGARVHGRKTAILREALIEYLDRKSMPPAMPEKKPEKKKAPVSREGESKRPRIRDDPMLVKKIDAMIADGKTIAEIAREIGYSWSTVKSYIIMQSPIATPAELPPPVGGAK